MVDCRKIDGLEFVWNKLELTTVKQDTHDENNEAVNWDALF